MDRLPALNALSPDAENELDAASVISIASSGTPAVAAARSPSHGPSSSQSSFHQRTNSQRQSFADNLRNMPSSPRGQRHPSFTGIPVQDLLSLPQNNATDPRFVGRDWRDITVGEVVSSSDVKWVTMDTSVEEATMALVKDNPTNVVLVRNEPNGPPVSSFNYNDLNAYLLAVVGLGRPEEQDKGFYEDIATRAREGAVITLNEIQPLCRKQPLVILESTETLARAIEVLGSGVHQVLVSDEAGGIIGILSQLKLIKFFWSEGLNFPSIETLYPSQIKDLGIGSKQVLSINSDSALADALTLMHDEGLTSVAVVDNGYNVVGNISTVDVRLLTNAASAPLLQASCMHFISVILNERGVEKGRDPFPVFHVNPCSSLAHTVAKLVATQSHRMWVVDPQSPSPSSPPTPSLPPAVLVPPSGAAPQSPTPGTTFNSIPASALPGANLSGRLSGVVSLTDILNLFAKTSGLNPSDPGEQRAMRRRSSSSSVRPSLDLARPNVDPRR